MKDYDLLDMTEEEMAHVLNSLSEQQLMVLLMHVQGFIEVLREEITFLQNQAH